MGMVESYSNTCLVYTQFSLCEMYFEQLPRSWKIEQLRDEEEFWGKRKKNANETRRRGSRNSNQVSLGYYHCSPLLLFPLVCTARDRERETNKTRRSPLGDWEIKEKLSPGTCVTRPTYVMKEYLLHEELPSWIYIYIKLTDNK